MQKESDAVLHLGGGQRSWKETWTREGVAGQSDCDCRILCDEHVSTIARLNGSARPGLHYDLFEQTKGKGAGVKLAHFCAPFGIPVKLDAGGARVAAFAADDQWDRIAQYCETDTIATWLVAQMWDSAEHPGYGRERWGKLAAWITADQPRLAHLLAYV